MFEFYCTDCDVHFGMITVLDMYAPKCPRCAGPLKFLNNDYNYGVSDEDASEEFFGSNEC